MTILPPQNAGSLPAQGNDLEWASIDDCPTWIRELSQRYYGDLGHQMRAALRNRSQRRQQLLALTASRDTASLAELTELARAIVGGDHTPQQLSQAEQLRPNILRRLATVIAGNADSGREIERASDLFLLVRRAFDSVNTSAFLDETELKTHFAAGRHDVVEQLLQTARPRPEVGWELATDIRNPFLRPVTGTESEWLDSFNELFRLAGIAPIALLDGDAAPFDRLSTAELPCCDGPEEPLVTVVLSAFGPGEWLRTAIRSLREQTWRNLQIVLVDDATPRSGTAIFDEMVALDDRIELIRCETNRGAYVARNLGIAQARGEFITIQDADDWSHPERIERQVRALQGNQQLMATWCRGFRLSDDLVINWIQGRAQWQAAASFCFRRSVLERLGQHDEVRRGADSEFINRLMAAYGPRSVESLPEPLLLMRLTAGSLSRSDFGLLWHHPARVAYRATYAPWHRAIAEGRATPVLDAGSRRYREAPHHIASKEPSPLRTADVAFLADWRPRSPASAGLADEIDGLHRSGLTVAALHAEHPQFAIGSRGDVPGRDVQEKMAEGKADWALFADPLHVRLAVVRDPELLNFLTPAGPSLVRADRAVIVAEQPSRAAHDGWLRFDPVLIEKYAAEHLGCTPDWLPLTPEVAESLRASGAQGQILPAQHLGVASWPVRRRVRPFQRPVVGTADPEIAAPPELCLETLERHFPSDLRDPVRVLTNSRVVSAQLSGDRRWSVRKRKEVLTEELVSELDIYVGLPNLTSSPYEHRTILTAMAAGCAVVLPSAYESTFGDAALYADGPQTAAAVKSLIASRRLRQRHSRRATEFCEAHLPEAQFVEAIRRLLGP